MQICLAQRVPAKLAQLFAIDLRSLAVFRIALGILLLLDLATRLPDLRGHYTDAGVWPRTLAVQEEVEARHWYFSVHLFGGSTAFEAVLFGVAALAAMALVVGWRTRIATIISWLLLISLHTRMERVVNSGDMLLRMLLFWSLFLPLGARWSLDARRLKAANPPQTVCSAATIALLLQVCIIYWFTVAYKWDASWTVRGDALQQILSMQSCTTPFGASLLAYPQLLRVFTFGTIALEILGPILVFVPVTNGLLRTLVVFIFCAFHLGALGTTISVGLFPFICAAAWLVFLPPWFWEKLLHEPGAAESAGRLTAHPAMNVLVSLFFALVLVWNFRGLHPKRLEMCKAVDPFVYLLHLDQRWAMFSGPFTYEVWQWAPAKLRDGSEVNLLTGAGSNQPPRPERLNTQFHSFRWSLYPGWAKSPSLQNPARMKTYAAFLKREWNENHSPEQSVVSLQIYCMQELIETPRAPAMPLLLYSDASPPAVLSGSDRNPVSAK